ncbi:isochorismatase family protein [Streptomyces sp. N2-109]|uniref:Isochorismatase family protein n=1 Tax=Streptomyces gossypii TaxID=2883101 RepID=A0ABT2JWG4_9ACTN|nr:isochorismatase family protein [Streptomyces gossypii]MCT2592221.1 isochorismatase family protein [Streptomyces gossypii]
MTAVNPAHTVLVLVDLMRRITELPLAPRTGQQAVEAACRLAGEFRTAGAPVVALRAERPNLDRQPSGSELVERVAALADSVVVKRGVGGFHGTRLAELLEGYDATTLVFGGIATNMGVESTARGASDRGFDLVFVEDAMTALTADEHHAAVTLNLPRFGRVITGGELSFATA